MTRDDVIDVLSVVAAATRRTVGNADVEIWQAVMGDLPKEPALKAVRAHLRECPGVWLEPGHIVARVRAERRDELEKESDEEREARRAALDAKVARDVDELAAAKALPPAGLKFQRPKVNPLLVHCTWCKAGGGAPCVVHGSSDQLRRGPRFHPCRVEAARSVVGGELGEAS